MQRSIKISVSALQISADAQQETRCRRFIGSCSDMKWSVSFGIVAVYIRAVARLITSQLKYHPLVACTGCNVQQRLIIFVLIIDARAQLDIREKIGKHLGIVVIYRIKEAISLLIGATEPFFDESFMIMTGQLLAMLEENLKALELIGVTCEH